MNTSVKTGRSTHRPPVRPARSPVWTAVVVAATVMTLLFVALMALELTSHADGDAPTVTVATASGPTGPQVVPLDPGQFTLSPNQSATVRLRNAADVPVTVAVVVDAPTDRYSGTLTAILTQEGSITRSGALGVLRMNQFTLGPRATIPVSLELSVDRDQIDNVWADTGGVSLVITAVTP